MRHGDGASGNFFDGLIKELAIAPGTHTVQESSPAFAIDREDFQAFIARWLRRFAAAATGSLSRPGGRPDHERSTIRNRRALQEDSA